MKDLVPKAAGFILVPALIYAVAPQQMPAMAYDKNGPVPHVIQVARRDNANTEATWLGLMSAGALIISMLTGGTARSVAQGATLGSALAAGLVLARRPSVPSTT